MTAYTGIQLANPAPGSGGKMPRVVERAIISGYAALEGALLLDNGDGTFVECGADPAQIGAVAVTPGGADTSGFNILGRKEFPPLFMQGYALQPDVRFLAPYLGAIPAATGGNFGATRDADSFWKIDFNKPGGAVFTYLGFPDRSPVDAAGAGQDLLALVSFQPGIIQPI